MGLQLLKRTNKTSKLKTVLSPVTCSSPDVILRKKMLLEDINRTRQALETAYSKFQYASDPELVDCYIYEIKSVDHRYKYLLEQLRKLTV